MMSPTDWHGAMPHTASMESHPFGNPRQKWYPLNEGVPLFEVQG